MTPFIAKLTFDNFDPPWLWGGIVVASLLVLFLTYRGMYHRSGRSLTWWLLGLRTAGVLAVLVAIIKPAWTHTSSHTERPRLAVVLDDSQSMGIMHRFGASEEYRTRYAEALRWLRNAPEAQQLRAQFDLTGFDITGQEMPIDNLPAEPSAEQSDLLRGLRAAAGRLRGQNAAGVLLISDGRDTTGRESFMAMQEYPLPVFSIGYRQPPPDKNMPFDLAILSVESPTRVLVHNTVNVKVLLSKDGGDAVEVPVQIERAGSPLLSQTVRLPAGAVPQQAVTLNFAPAEPGDFVLTVRVPEQPNERTTANNVRMFKLRVDAEPIRVLYVEGFLRPEYTFLRDRLGGDPDVDLVTFVRAANPEQAGVAGAAMAAELISADRLKKIDVVLLGDFEADMLDADTYSTLRRWVEDGGALMVLGGYHNLGDGGLGKTPIAEALPVELSDTPLVQLEKEFRWKITEEGKRHPALTITGDMARDSTLWEALPPLRGLVAVRGPKPAASVLARHPEANPETNDKQGFVVLAVQPFGKGTTAIMTADTTWRWSRLARLAGAPDTMYVRFWSQMIRWLARREIKNDRPALTLSTDAASYDRGARVSIRIKRNPASMVPGMENIPAATTLTVRSPDGRVTQVPVIPSSDPNQWTASYFPDRGGRFTLDARLVSTTEKGGKDLANQTAEFIVQDSALEREDPSTSPGTLAEISRRTGGAYADIDDQEAMKQLVDRLPSQTRTVFETQKAVVWNNPGLFMLFLACIAAEWIVRRKNQLV